MKFLASVGTAQLFRIEDGQPKPVATARTLTETSLQFSSQPVEVVSGAGEQLTDMFVGSSRLKIDLTEVNFNLDYISSLLNPACVSDPKVFFSEKQKVKAGQTIDLSHFPSQLGNSFGLDEYLIFYKNYTDAENKWNYYFLDKTLPITKTITLPDNSLQVGDEVCLKYIISAPQARSVLIGTNFIPSELLLELTTKLISSETDRIEDGKMVGEVVVKIPRFKLDSNFNLQMAMSSFSSVPISGTALAYVDELDPFSQRYGEIIEYHAETKLQAGLQSIYVDAETNRSFGLYKDGHTGLMPIDVSVPDDIFDGCLTLTQVQLPDSVESVENYAFQGCDNLAFVTLFAATPPSASTTSFPLSTTFYVLPRYVDAYTATTPWSTTWMKNRVSPLPARQLFPPTLMTTSKPDEFKITGETMGETFAIYANSVFKGTVAAGSSTNSVVVNVYTLNSDSVTGEYVITAISQKSGFFSSDFSEPLSYDFFSVAATCLYGTFDSISPDSAVVRGGSIQCEVSALPLSTFPNAGGITCSGCSGYDVETTDPSSRKVTLNNAFGPVSFTISYIPNSYSLAKTVINGSLEGPASLAAYTTATLTFVPSNGYTYPLSVSVAGSVASDYDSTTGQLTLSNPSGSVTVAATCTDRTYDIGWDITNGQVEGPDQIQRGHALPLTVSAYDLYNLPQSVSVTGATAAYDPTTGALLIRNPTGNVRISGTCPPKTFTIRKIVQHGTISGASRITAYSSATLTLSPATGYDLPYGISVTSAEYSYASETGVITLRNPTNTVAISATCVATTFSVDSQVTNGYLTGASWTIAFASSAEFTFVPTEGYTYPAAVTIINAEKQYDYHTGALIVSNPTGDINIAATCPTAVYSVTPSIVYGSLEGPPVIGADSSAEFTIAPSQGYTYPSSGAMVVDGASYAYTPTTGKLVLRYPDGNVTVETMCFGGDLQFTAKPGATTCSVSMGTWAGETLTIPSVSPGNLSVVKVEGFNYQWIFTRADFESPSNVAEISNQAFYKCPNLASITIPNSVTSIGGLAFESCTSLTSITFEENSQLTSIGNEAFHYCTSLTSIEIPNSVTSVGKMAFVGCSALEHITVIEGNPRYHNAWNCIIETATKTLIVGCKNSVIPDDGSVTSIGSSAFYQCTSLTSFEIPNSVTSIGEEAFAYCRSLTSIEIPNSVTSIGEEAFSWCSSLTSVTFEENSQLTSIGNYAFWNCTSLSSITIPNSVPSIGEGAFSDCSSLTSITIPNSVTSIGEVAFDNCSSLSSITYTGTMEQWNAINKGSYWNWATNYYVIYCTDGNLPKWSN